MIQAIILAGGKGTRMNSSTPKVLHKIGGVFLIEHSIKNLVSICEKPTIIVGYKAEEIIEATENSYNYVLQKEQLGTGHAVACAKQQLENNKDIDGIIVVPGDHPFFSQETLNGLVFAYRENGAVISLVSFVCDRAMDSSNDFYCYGRKY